MGTRSQPRRVRLQVEVLEDRTVPAFLEPVGVASGNLYVATADFNNDGYADLVSTRADRHDVEVRLGNGDGTFQPATRVPTAVTQSFALFRPQTGDFNGDGHMDILTAGITRLHLIPGNGDGTFRAPIETTMPSVQGEVQEINALAVGDFNGDGRLDAVVGTSTRHASNTKRKQTEWGDQPGTSVTYKSHVNVLLGDASGVFKAAGIAQDVNSGLIGVADFNGDGKLDVLTSGDDLFVILGKGGGALSKPKRLDNAGTLSAIGDFNGDGKADLLITGSGGLTTYFGTASSTFQTGPSLAIDLVGRVVVADVNNDGKLDLVGRTSSDVVVLMGNGDGSFQTPLTLGIGSVGTGFAGAADFNGDGWLDVYLSGYILFNDSEW